MSSCTATSRLVHNGGYLQKLLQLFNSPEILLFGGLYLLAGVLGSILQYFGNNTVHQISEIRHYGPVCEVS